MHSNDPTVHIDVRACRQYFICNVPTINYNHPLTLQDDELTWRSPPSRQLSREKRIEYESDVKERFYDDYIGNRTS